MKITWRHCALCVVLFKETTVFQTSHLWWLAFQLVCWGENITAGDAGRKNKPVIKAFFVALLSLNTPEASVQERRTKPNSILDSLSRLAPSIMRWHRYRESSALSLRGAPEEHRFLFVLANIRLLSVQMDVASATLERAQAGGSHAVCWSNMLPHPTLCFL